MPRRDLAEPQRPVRAVIPARAVRSAAVTQPPMEPHKSHAVGPTVEVVREGDVVRAIDVTCACGERIRIVCEYGQ